MTKVKLGATFYPAKVDDKDIPFDSLFIPYIYKEAYLEGVYVDIFNNKKDMVVMDVGANIGLITAYMRPYCKKIYAIEPAAEHFTALKKNKEFNEWNNVEIFNVAFADKVGEMVLAKNEGNRTMHSLMHGKQAESTGYAIKNSSIGAYSNQETVKTIDFETFFKQNKIEKIDFVKFDVEGSEDLILRSDAFKKAAPLISAIEVEFHFDTWNLLVNYMIELGFEARRYDSSAIIVLFTR